MVKILKGVVAAAFMAASVATGHAATVAIGGTGSTGAGGFTLASGTIVNVSNAAYFNGATTPASNWVWESSRNSSPLQFLFKFSLSAFQLASATLSGLWGVDNTGEVKLNGTTISSLPNVVSSNFTALTAFSATSSLFTSGLNTLSFDVANFGVNNPAAFRASVEVTAVAAVPLPATLPLMGGAVMALGVVAKRRKRTKKSA